MVSSVMTTEKRPILQEWEWAIERARAPRLPSLREFAETDIVIPKGRFATLRFRCERQPYTRLWFDAVSSGLWTRFAALGPTQSGKSLSGYVIPLVYHLCMIGESVICGLPDMAMAADKWHEDIEPVIAASRFQDLLPRSGSGSRGGDVKAVRLTTGAVLRFMSAGGKDKARSAYTARVLVITEADGFDESGSTSREADKITQLEARLDSYPLEQRVEYLECTVSIERGRIWREWKEGTASRIMLPCPDCRVFVCPEREHLVGWEGADNELEAGERARWCCPACGGTWTEEERAEANRRSVLLHRGQEIDEAGTITGEPPRTATLGFRWTAVNNLFWLASDVGRKEWLAARDPDEDNAEKKMRQFTWCLPYIPPLLEVTPLDPRKLQRRVQKLTRGIVPAETQFLTVAIDLGKWFAHWIVIAWLADGSSHIVDYGGFDIPTKSLGSVERAIMVALREFRDVCMTGWNMGGDMRVPDQVWIDCSYERGVVYLFCRESNKGCPAGAERFRPAMGRGTSQQRAQWYNRPKSTGALVKHVGEGYHISWQKADRILLVECDADYWKTWAHNRLASEIGSPGAMTLFQAMPNEHMTISMHFTAERQVEEFIEGKGTVIRWEQTRRSNHWLDCLYNACAAGHLCGVRLLKESAKVGQNVVGERRRRLTMPDGRAYLATER